METIVNKDMEAVVHSLRDGKYVCVGSDANNVNIITIVTLLYFFKFRCVLVHIWKSRIVEVCQRL